MTQMNTSDNPLLKLSPKDLPSLLKILADRYVLYAPYTVGNGVRFLPFRDAESVNLTQLPPTHSAKSVLLPNPEILFTYTRERDGKFTLYPKRAETRDLLIFGMRSCDVRALSALDAVFLHRNMADTTYQHRRKGLLIIGIGCPSPSDTCFCERMGGGPFDETGMDVQLIPLPGAYILKGVSPQGQVLLSSVTGLLQEVEDSISQEVTNLINKTPPHTPTTPVNFKTLKQSIAARQDDPYWEQIANVCLGCGICTFLCPVCTCFTLMDSGKLLEGRRLRIWDTCMFPGFTQEASGHNPRGKEVQRVKQRFFHKFYYSLENGEPPGCVGCGRCVAHCPAGIDIREIISHFHEEVP